ncbi:hypothetical protein ADUPG1_013204, partial [Aduncisulcus paluster]
MPWYSENAKKPEIASIEGIDFEMLRYPFLEFQFSSRINSNEQKLASSLKKEFTSAFHKGKPHLFLKNHFSEFSSLTEANREIALRPLLKRISAFVWDNVSSSKEQQQTRILLDGLRLTPLSANFIIKSIPYLLNAGLPSSQHPRHGSSGFSMGYILGREGMLTVKEDALIGLLCNICTNDDAIELKHALCCCLVDGDDDFYPNDPKDSVGGNNSKIRDEETKRKDKKDEEEEEEVEEEEEDIYSRIDVPILAQKSMQKESLSSDSSSDLLL